MPYVRLNELKHISVHGQSRTYYPGDTVEVGRQAAEQWILDGSAEDPYGTVGQVDLDNADDYGIVVWADPDTTQYVLPQGVNSQFGEPSVPYKYTLILRPSKPITRQLINYGWLRISENNPDTEPWEMAAGLVDLETTAETVGDAEMQEQTEKMVGDLRVPVYDTSRIWIRKTYATEKFLGAFLNQLQKREEYGADYIAHCFLRALYTTNPALCTLPFDWTSR